MYDPPAAQLSADPHDSEMTRAFPPTLSDVVPGTSSAVAQAPAVSSTTNAWVLPELSLYDPPAAQLPAEPQESEETVAFPPTLRDAVPGTSSALPQVPAVSSTTNACVSPELSSYDPPAGSCRGPAREWADVTEIGR